MSVPAEAPEPAEDSAPEQRGWGFERGDEVVPGCAALQKLGGGTAYEAYVAFDEKLLTPVVVKVVRPHLVSDSTTLRGLRREVDMVGRLNHPVIVRGFHAVTDGSRPYLALEHLQGPRLSTLLRKHGPHLPMEQVLPLALQLCTALHYLRQMDVVHLDVKPSNIIMGPVPRLIDLSIARDVDRARRLRQPVGTDRYMAPEQCDPVGSGPPGVAADVWGLGATLFQAVAGFRPFADGSKDDDVAPQERWPQLCADPRSFPDRTPDAVATPILRCLSKQPEERPEPSELFEELEPLVAALPKPKIGMWRPRI